MLCYIYQAIILNRTNKYYNINYYVRDVLLSKPTEHACSKLIGYI